MVVPSEPSSEQLVEIQERRCASQGRGSVYDSAVGEACGCTHYLCPSASSLLAIMHCLCHMHATRVGLTD